jgi:hypothetical protein
MKVSLSRVRVMAWSKSGIGWHRGKGPPVRGRVGEGAQAGHEQAARLQVDDGSRLVIVGFVILGFVFVGCASAGRVRRGTWLFVGGASSAG